MSFLGPKFNKNGWKYDNRPDKEVAKKITKIYCKITRKQKVMNKQLSITFSKMIIVEAKGKPMNWVGFGARTIKQQLLLKKTKQQSTKIPIKLKQKL